MNANDLVWWLLHVLGLDNVSGTWYAFWSGFGSDLSEVVAAGALLGLLWQTYRKHNCHVHGCWRIGRHPVEGTLHVVCRHHHPHGAPTHEHILALHRRSEDQK